jgi:AcrR family transcriptional regulator
METRTTLRERHKQQTRQLIFEAASDLFVEHGFDAVTVAEVARAADVSEMTVFNHYPTKEDLFFSKMQFFEEKLLAGVRERPESVTALDAFRHLVIEGCSRLAAEENAEMIAKAAGLIAGSPALQVREREIVTRYTQLLAEQVAGETEARVEDVEPQGVAGALMAVHRALVAYVRASVLAGQRGPKLAGAARSQATRAFARLESGLSNYAIKGG